MERYVAVDNVCAWPNLTLLPQGEIIATIFNQPCHGLWTGDVECWASTDEGKMWELRGIPAPHDPGTNRMNVAAGLARNGDLIVLASGWDKRPEKGLGVSREFSESLLLPCWVCRSGDAGRTWTHAATFASPAGARRVIPYGKIISLSDGTLAASAYSERVAPPGRTDTAWFYRSSDDGRTWGVPIRIGDGYNETDILFADGRLLAAARTQSEGRLDLLVSEDAGATWRLQGPLTGASEHPANLLRLSDQSILLTYSIRHRGFFGLGARLSEDAGRTWYSPWALVSFDDAFDGGYPSSVELPDGSILTAYYASGVSAHTRYHMGALRWDRREQAARNQPRPGTF